MGLHQFIKIIDRSSPEIAPKIASPSSVLTRKASEDKDRFGNTFEISPMTISIIRKVPPTRRKEEKSPVKIEITKKRTLLDMSINV